VKLSNPHKKLIKACLRGDRKAQFDLYEQHKVYLYGVCLRYAKSKEEAQDILQEGFYKIFKNLGQYKGDGPLQAWMRKVMVNTALMHLRKYGKTIFTDLDEHTFKNVNLTDRTLLEQDRANAIIHLIQQLPSSYQTVFNLRAIEGYSFKEISQNLDINEATLRSHYLRARKYLQKLLQKEMNKYG